MNRRAKIVCTLGPATSSYEGIRGLVYAGMDVARLNFSHGAYAQHEQAYRWVRQASDESGRGVGVLVDLQGPKIRLGTFAAGPVVWATGETVTITTDDVEGTHDRVSTTYKGLAADVSVGDRLLVDDGRVGLRVVAVEGNDVRLTVTEGGPVSNNKGLSLPGIGVSVPALSEKDEEDLRFGLTLRADMVALSFVRSAKDITRVHEIMDEMGVRLPVLAKIEKPQAVDNLDEIIDAFDGLMVARGDLGVEMPLEMVPLVQKRAVQACREQAKPVIVATQMLESMIGASRPTRAEASDVANAVLDGADAVMLSGETSVGQYPVEAVATMARIISAAEQDIERVPRATHEITSIAAGIARAAAEVGRQVGASALVAFTQSGSTARLLAKHRSPIPLLAFTPVAGGAQPAGAHLGRRDLPRAGGAAHRRHGAPGRRRHARASGACSRASTSRSSPAARPRPSGTTNAMRVHRLGSPVPQHPQYGRRHDDVTPGQ